MQVSILLTFLSLFIFSPTLLYLIGTGYMSPAASALAKIHPSTYLALISLALSLMSPKAAIQTPSRIAATRMVTGVSAFLLFYTVVNAGGGEGGGEISVLLVTFLSAGLLALLVTSAQPKTLDILHAMIGVFFLANSGVGLLELLSGQRLMPFVISEEVILWDLRPTSLLGHPLLNSLLTGAWLLTLIMQGFQRQFRGRDVIVLGIHTLAMFAFGGRASLVTMLAIAAVYMLLKAFTALLSSRSTKHAVLAFFGLYAALLVVPFIFTTDFATMIVDRFVDAKGSDETRYAAIQMLSTLSINDWLTGISSSARNSLQVSAGSVHGIEISWVALTLQFGLPITCSLLFLTWRLLRSSLVPSLERFLLLAYFFTTTFTSLSIGSKSLLISQVFLIFSLYTHRSQSAPFDLAFRRKTAVETFPKRIEAL